MAPMAAVTLIFCEKNNRRNKSLMALVVKVAFFIFFINDNFHVWSH
jgi:hypothetical protein